MFKSFPFLLLIVLSVDASGQRTWDYVAKKTDSLQKSGIDTIVLYRPYSDPLTQETTDSCMVYDRGYMLWKKEQNLFILQHYEYYNLYNQAKGISSKQYALPDTLNLFGYLKDHFQQVVTDTLLPVRLRMVKDNKEIFEDITYADVRDNAYTGITVLAGNKSYNNSYSDIYLNDGNIRNVDGTVREKWESLNYQANLNKSIYQFITRIEKQVAIVFGWK